MTCVHATGEFKGVVVTTAITLTLLVSSCFPPFARSHDARAAISLIPASSSTKEPNWTDGRTSPHCVYLKQSQELDCLCPDDSDGFVDEPDLASQNITEAPLITITQTEAVLFPNSKVLAMAGNGSVASVKIRSCTELHLKLDFQILDRPFYRLRIEGVPKVTIDGITLIQKDMVDIWFRNVSTSLTLLGGFECLQCQDAFDYQSDANIEESEKPQLNIHILDNNNVTLKNMFVSHMKVKVKVRNAQEMLIQDSYFYALPKDSIEVFHVPKVIIHHSEFHRTTNSSILLNKVNELLVSDSLLMRSAIEILSNLTLSNWTCTISPLDSPSDVLSPEEQETCSKHKLLEPHGGVESQGALVLALISSILLIVAIAVLLVLNRVGKLNQYL